RPAAGSALGVRQMTIEACHPACSSDGVATIAPPHTRSGSLPLGSGSTLEDRAMKKMSRLPHEEKNLEDGLPAEFLPTDSDVEGHVIHTAPAHLGTQLPGTGGAFRMPSGGGELTDDDVEGH